MFNGENFLCIRETRKLFNLPEKYTPETLYLEISSKRFKGSTRIRITEDSDEYGFAFVEGSSKSWELYYLPAEILNDMGGTAYVRISYDYEY